MNEKQLLDEVLAMLSTIRDDKHKLQKLHAFMINEVYEEPEQEDISKMYKKVVQEIADNLLAGFICFYNPDTLEIEPFQKEWMNDPDEHEAITGETLKIEEVKHKNWRKYIEITPMESHEAFKVMEYFIEEVKDRQMKNALITALKRHRPFAKFKSIVESSACRQQWFDFRQKEWGKYAWSRIEEQS